MTAAQGLPAAAGLSSAAAASRLADDGPNELPSARPRGLPRQAWDVVRQPMLLLLLVAGTVNFVLAEPLDGVTLMSFVVVVIAISVYQEHKTENALAALRDLTSPRALVLRDGLQKRVAGREVVRGDVTLLSEGDRVPADAVLLDCVNLSVDESALTGESVAVRKAPASPEAGTAMGPPGGDGTPWVFSGTLVVRGRGVALVQRTGVGTELGRIGAALRAIETEQTPLQREVTRLVQVVAVVGLAAAAAVVVLYGLTRGSWLEGVLAGIAVAMAMLPEEFPVVLTVFLALGAWRMSQKHVLTRRAAVVEALGSATVICVDKTGTLTMNAMTVRELVVGDRSLSLGDAPLPEEFHPLAEFLALASPVDPFDPMDKAFRSIAEDHLAGTEHLHPGWALVREYPLSERLLAMTHVWRSPDGAQVLVAVKGAPEAVADLCHLDADAAGALITQVKAATASGRRVLAAACARVHDGEALPLDPHDFDFELLGLAALQDPVRPGAAEAVAECARAGVRTIMITGDYPGTAVAVAREIGLDRDGEVLTGPELDALSDEQLARRVATVSVFARMVPEQKLRLVRALRSNGEVVGMTGDGVNDAPALKAADIGIAMGARGTDVAREAAALVITDDDVASIASGIRQGRGIFANLRKAMAYILAVHVPIIGMALIPVLVPQWPLVLLPVQIAFLELIIDPACSVVFEAEQIDPGVMRQPPRPTGAPLFGRRVVTVAALQGLTVLAAVLAVYLWGVLSGRPDDVVRSMTFTALVSGNLALILVNRSWHLSAWRSLRDRRNPALPWVLGGAVVLFAALMTVPPLRDAFALGALGPTELVVGLLAGFVGVAWFELYKRLGRAATPGA